MSARGARTLSRLFQATMRIAPEKRYSDILEDVIPVLLENDFEIEPDFSLTKDERIWHYHAKLLFKDGEFLVRAVFVSKSRPRSPFAQDMDLVDKQRQLLCAGKLFLQSDSTFGRRGKTETLVLLFDNYR
jgi:hypothetical protein